MKNNRISHDKNNKGILSGIAIFGVIFVGVTLVMYVPLHGGVPLRDAIFGVPIEAKRSVGVDAGNQFSMTLEVPCNSLYTREVGFRIDPPVPVVSVTDAPSAVSGNVSLSVQQRGDALTEEVQLSETGWSVKDGGVWLKVIYRYGPMGGFFCGKQNIRINAKNLNLGLSRYDIAVYVSRDRRP